MTTKSIICRLAPVAALFLVAPVPAAAHNLIMEAYAYGDAVEGEAFFSDGTLARNATIVVTGDNGKLIQEVITDEKGNFSYLPLRSVTQHLRIDLGSGHIAEAAIDGAELTGAVATPAATPTTTVAAAPIAEATAGPAAAVRVSDALQRQIDAMVATEIEPLQTEIERYKTHNDFMNMLAAFGILCGAAGALLFGAGARKVESAPASAHGGRSARTTS